MELLQKIGTAIATGFLALLSWAGGADTPKNVPYVSLPEDITLGATWNSTDLTDTIGTFRTNVNTSLHNINAALSDSTSTDPGHAHTSGAISGVIATGKGGTGTSTTPSSNTLLVGTGSGYEFTNAIPDCTTATSSLRFASSTRQWSCGAAVGVDVSTDQTISGIKTFASGTVLSAGATSTFTGNALLNGSANTIATTTFSSTQTFNGPVVFNGTTRGISRYVYSTTTDAVGVVADGVNGNVEQTLATSTIPANTMGSSSILKVTATWKQDNGADTATVRLKFGGTTFMTATTTRADSSTGYWTATLFISNSSTTLAQVGDGFISGSGPTNTGTSTVVTGVTGAVNTGAEQVVNFSKKFNTTINSTILNLVNLVIEVLQP